MSKPQQNSYNLEESPAKKLAKTDDYSLLPHEKTILTSNCGNCYDEQTYCSTGSRHRSRKGQNSIPLYP